MHSTKTLSDVNRIQIVKGWSKKIKVAQNVLKFILFSEFLKSNNFFFKWLISREFEV